jgi:hypothetical protein
VGTAITASGKVLVETGDQPYNLEKGDLSDSVIALSEKDLKAGDCCTPANRARITRKDLAMGNLSPAVFPFKERELVAGGGQEGVLYLLGVKSRTGADHRTGLCRSPLYANEEVNFAARGFWDPLSTWEDGTGTRWLYAPAWRSPTGEAKSPCNMARRPMQHQGLRGGRKERQSGSDSHLNFSRHVGADWFSRSRTGVIRSRRALMAGFSVSSVLPIQATPSCTCWTSSLEQSFSGGETIHGFTFFGGPVVSDGRIYVATHDSTVYSSGLEQ